MIAEAVGDLGVERVVEAGAGAGGVLSATIAVRGELSGATGAARGCDEAALQCGVERIEVRPVLLEALHAEGAGGGNVQRPLLSLVSVCSGNMNGRMVLHPIF